MPEIAEVELLRRQLSVLERAVVQSVVTDGNPRFAAARASAGQAFGLAERKGKWLSIPLEVDGLPVGTNLGIHLGMTGQLTLSPPAAVPIKWRCRFDFADGRTLYLADSRGFGRVVYASMPFGGVTLGIEPGETGFADAVRKAGGNGGAPIVLSLLAQNKVAGIGAYVAQEGLWRSGISPHRRHIDDGSITTLASCLEAVVLDSLATGGMTMRDYRRLDGSVGDAYNHLDCYGRAGQPCRRCGGLLRKDRIGGRGVTWCPSCQH